jgi:RimJ/RimL family protein N-acetyltransferase
MIYTGLPFGDGVVDLGPPDIAEILRTPLAGDVAGDVHHYLACAPAQADMLYFCIYEHGAPVGQIVLHDMNLTTGESLIGYCLFQPELRGRGVGTRALRLLQQYVTAHMTLVRLIIITDINNHASQAIACKCGFQFTGGAREDPEQLLVFEWQAGSPS